jgi:integral membrane protein (TIGR00529 family)
VEFVGLLLSFGIILFLVKRKLNVGFAMVLGSIIMAPFISISLEDFLGVLRNTITSFNNIQLSLTVLLISGLGYAMKETKLMENFISGLYKITGDVRILMALIPIFIGTLSVPGGAILSAPMVDELGNRAELNQERKTAINLIYRHIGFFVFPLYPYFILATQLANVSKTSFMVFNLPIVASGLIVSFLVFFKGIVIEKRTNRVKLSKGDIKDVIFGLLPISIAIIMFMVFNLSMAISVSAGLAFALNANIKGDYFSVLIERLGGAVKRGFKYDLVVVVMGIMLFKGMLEYSGIISTTASTLTQAGIPLWLLIIILGSITSYLSGLQLTSIAILVPLFIPLLPKTVHLPYLALIYTSAIIGYWISPLHLCLVLTKEFFKSDLLKVYRLLTLPITAVLTTTIIMFIIFAR